MFNKLEKYVFYFFLFAIPFQTRKILWYSGWRFNEWQSVSLYATDILLLILFGFWAFNYFSTKYQVSSIKYHGKDTKTLILNTKYLIQKSDVYLIAFFAVSGISILNSSNPIISSFQWFKLAELIIFYWYLSHYAFGKFGLVNSFFSIMMGGLFQAVIAIIQFLKQSNVGLKYLGESFLNSEIGGVASFYLPTGEKIIRAYGTLPHPNVLAAFLFLSLFSFYFVYLYSKLHSEHEPFADKFDRFLIASYCIILFAFFTTFSRVVIFIWFVSFCFRSAIIRAVKNYRIIFGTQEGRKRIKVILIVSFVVIILFSLLCSDEIRSRSNIGAEDQAVQLRNFYNKQALDADINLFGIGTGNFVGWLMNKEPFLLQYAYQPIHNIYLLIYSETGMLGLMVFILFLFFLIRDFILRTRLRASYHLSLLVFFGALLFIGFFDHFFWTLQQGRFIFWSSLALLTQLDNWNG